MNRKIKLDKAIEALNNNDTSKADELLKQIEEDADKYIKHSANAAYNRARIAVTDSRYRDAKNHFAKALSLDPENAEYIKDSKEFDEYIERSIQQLEG